MTSFALLLATEIIILSQQADGLVRHDLLLEKKFTLAIPNHHQLASTSRELSPFLPQIEIRLTDPLLEWMQYLPFQLSGTKVKSGIIKSLMSVDISYLTRFWSTEFAHSFSLGWFALQSLTLFTSRTKKILNNWATYSWAPSARQTWFATKILRFQRTVYSQFKRLNTNYKYLVYFPSTLGNQPETIKYQFPHIAI